MSGLLGFLMGKWEGEAIEVHCSYVPCKNTIMVDSTKITGLLFCSQKCGEKEFEE